MSELKEVSRKDLWKKDIYRKLELDFGAENLLKTNKNINYYSVLILKGDASKKNKDEQYG